MKFVDEASIKVHAGKGGNGCLSFRRKNIFPKVAQMVAMGVMAAALFWWAQRA